MAKSTRRSKKVVTIFTESDIAKRAFELYCERGCQDGRDLEDWLQAERELQESAPSTAA